MKSTFDSRKNAVDEPVISTTNSYIEIEIPLNENISSFVYLIPRNSNSVFVVTCWEHFFDDLVSNIDQDDFETISETWPTLGELLINGIKDRYQYGALIVGEDPDYGENKWFIASIAGNISFDNEEELFGERTNEAIGIVLEKSLKVFVELNERSPSMTRAILKGIGAGVGAVVVAALSAFLGVDLDEYS